jgi:DNA ligase D-like protein (predicted 3'-phosphoesterase)
MPIFVVHEHHAKKLHWDFRLEMGGVLKSWAVPKEPPIEPGLKRLAIQVEDHDIGYAKFEGEIAEGYGAGEVKIWDSGSYELLEKTEKAIVVKMKGTKLKGEYVLFKFEKAGAKNWLMFKRG